MGWVIAGTVWNIPISLFVGMIIAPNFTGKHYCGFWVLSIVLTAIIFPPTGKRNIEQLEDRFGPIFFSLWKVIIGLLIILMIIEWIIGRPLGSFF